jgi:hypothetical protein
MLSSNFPFRLPGYSLKTNKKPDVMDENYRNIMHHLHIHRFTNCTLILRRWGNFFIPFPRFPNIYLVPL